MQMLTRVMKAISLSPSNSDYSGAIASTLCLLHCMATPFLFFAQSTSFKNLCHTAPAWWQAIDYLFLVITFFAVRQSSNNSSKEFMKYILYGTWAALTLLTLNENIHLFNVTVFLKYMAALSLISAHLYNLKFCQCKGDSCCLHV